MVGNIEPTGVHAASRGEATCLPGSFSQSTNQMDYGAGAGGRGRGIVGDGTSNSESATAGPSRPRSRAEPSSSHQHQRLASPEIVTESTTANRANTTASSSSSSATELNSNSTATTVADSPRLNSPHLDIATYPTPALLRLLARILQQIASANDQLRSEFDEDIEMLDGGGSADDASNSASTRSTSRHSSQTHPSPTTALFNGETPQIESFSTSTPSDKLFTASITSLSQSSSLLSFHARHVPSISIEAYLLRILKYCPTTNEVFLGLLVYFDRMSKLGTLGGVGGTGAAVGPRGFAIDSYNIHRLVIAGVTVASKFFSDVFYTNSRYAKVGGLPPHELNQLELQFLLLNDFRLRVPPEEMQKYADRLIAYWMGREAETGIDALTGLDAPRPEVNNQSRDELNHNQPCHRQSSSTSSAVATDSSRSVATPGQATTSASVSSSSRHEQRRSSATGASTNGPPSTNVVVASRGRERDRDRPTVSFAPSASQSTSTTSGGSSSSSSSSSSTATVSAGIREWASRGDEGVGTVLAGRMSSPIRD